jgi:pimeloyl-ACP methyl ester carboxylesterase
MAKANVGGSRLAFELIDLTPPWVEAPETVVMHHGIGATGAIWSGWLPALIDRYRVLLFDMRGHGGSRSASDVPVSLDGLVDDLLAVMDAVGLGRAHLVGESIGGTVALAAALRAPERVDTLAISNGAHVGARLQALHDWRAVMDRGGMAGWSAHMMPHRFFPDGISQAQWRWFERIQAEADREVVLGAVAALVGADLSEAASALPCPLLLMHPDSSPFIPVPVVDDLRRRVRDARLHVIGRARHGMPVSHATTCSALLRGFLDEKRRDS